MTSGRKDQTYTNPVRSQEIASSPPRINWSARPKAYKCDMGTPNGSQGPSSMATTQAESATDDSGDRRQLELLLRHFGRSVHVASGRNIDNQQDGADSPGVESNGVNIPITTLNQIEQQDGHDFQSEPSRVLDLTAAFSHLSTLNTPAPLVPRVPPGFPPYSVTFQPLRSAKYYVIVKGKCAGVYYGEWDDIKCLTEHVPGARYKSFKTLQQATVFYLDAKCCGKVEYIRNPGDVARFGPDKDAVQ